MPLFNNDLRVFHVRHCAEYWEQSSEQASQNPCLRGVLVRDTGRSTHKDGTMWQVLGQQKDRAFS